ncbi:hypothetical protein COCON_G00000320 [Conger conger]|uniref:TNF receptor-associated factor n=1 Tax=Conger conger TaxID=82655 RepID=A0A9Q1E0F5_CONCO|nr:hypothetical protein COCON_G00000320 [Conger conger]
MPFTEADSVQLAQKNGAVGLDGDKDIIHVMSSGRSGDGREVQLPQQRAPSLAQRPWSEPGFLPLQGGFRDRFLLQPEPKYCCQACRLVLCSPRQTECGHRFCETCIAELLRMPHPVCPADMEPLFEDKIFRDVCCNKEIMALKVYCRSEKNGCREQMSLQQVTDMPDHLSHFEVPCPLGKCKERMMRKDMPDHLSRKCRHREATCEFCQHKMAQTELQKHKDTVCPAFPVACPNSCTYSSSILRSELQRHQQDCPKAQVTCAFHRYGCTFKGLNQDLKEHESSCVSEHLRLMVAKNTTMEAKVEDIKGDLQERYKVLPGLNARLMEVETRQEEMREKSRQVEQKLTNMQKQLSSHSEKLMELEMEVRSLRVVREEVDTLRGAVESIRTRVTALEGGRGPPNPGTHAYGSLETQLCRHDDMLSVHEIRLADMDLRFQVLETASFGGTLIWKIRDYKRRKQEAVASKTLSLYSQPFYTGYFGYKMCARVYLNGDGMGKGTHLSLFFVVMRGEYDALLTWPFKQKVTLMLMDQGPARKHLGDAFKPDPTSSSFRRPTVDMNIASGCPLFVAQTVLENGTYIKDDTIFIKVTVDTSDLPDP